MKSLLAEEDPQIAKTALEADLKILEGMLATYPDDRELLTLTAHGFTGYALLYLEDNEPERALIFYNRAVNYALKGLSDNSESISNNNLTYSDFSKQLDKLKQEDIPLAYWCAISWSSSINLQLTSPKAITELPRAKLLMEWVYEQDSTYYYAGPQWYFAAFYASLPRIFGGNPDLAYQYYTNANRTFGEHFLLGKVLFAKSYAVNTLDSELFKRLLTEVINTDIHNCPEDLVLLNVLAKVKARELLDNIEKYF